MKGLIVFICTVAGLLGVGSLAWWLIDGTLPEDQLAIIQYKINGDGTNGSAISHTTDSASKLGRVLKGSFEEAKDVYENGAEAKY